MRLRGVDVQLHLRIRALLIGGCAKDQHAPDGRPADQQLVGLDQVAFKGARVGRVLRGIHGGFHPSIPAIHAIRGKIPGNLGFQCIRQHARTHHAHGGFASRLGFGGVDQGVLKKRRVAVANVDGANDGFDLPGIQRCRSRVIVIERGHTGRQRVVDIEFTDILQRQLGHGAGGAAQFYRGPGT